MVIIKDLVDREEARELNRRYAGPSEVSIKDLKVRRIGAFLLSLLFLTFVAGGLFESYRYIVLAEKPGPVTWPAVVEVVAGFDCEDARVATGFNIDPSGVIVTCRHLVEGSRQISVNFPGLGSYPVEGRQLLGGDLALLFLDRGGLPVLELSKNPDFSPGQEILVVGYPLDRKITERGRVAGYMDGVVLIDVPICPGHSGSPVIDDSGLVVAVVFGALTLDTEQVGLAIPVDVLSSHLNK